MREDNFDRAMAGCIRFFGMRGDASRGDVDRIRKLFGAEVARAQWAIQAARVGIPLPAPVPKVPWW